MFIPSGKVQPTRRLQPDSGMNPQLLPYQTEPDHPVQTSQSAITLPSSPSLRLTSPALSQRRIAIAVDLSDESALTVQWAVQNYLRPGDSVILLHVRPTSVLFGVDWGSVDHNLTDTSKESQQKLEDDFDVFTSTKATDLAKPLVEADIPFKIHIVKDHDMKERLCLEVERLGLSAVIIGSRGFGATKRTPKSSLGSVSDYCVHHCVCPVVVVRLPDEKDGCGTAEGKLGIGQKVELHPVLEEEQEEYQYHNASDEQKGFTFKLSLLQSIIIARGY